MIRDAGFDMSFNDLLSYTGFMISGESSYFYGNGKNVEISYNDSVGYFVEITKDGK